MAKTEKDPAPLTREQLRMVTEFRKYRDIYKAAEKARIPKNQAVRVFNLAQFQEELDRQDEVVREERARQQVKAEALTNELIDQELATMVRLDSKEHGSLKLDAIRTALVVNGRIQSGTMRSLEVGAARPDDDGEAVRKGNVYSVIFPTAEQAKPAPLLPPEPASATNVPDATEPGPQPDLETVKQRVRALPTPPPPPAVKPGPPQQPPPFRNRVGPLKIG